MDKLLAQQMPARLLLATEMVNVYSTNMIWVYVNLYINKSESVLFCLSV